MLRSSYRRNRPDRSRNQIQALVLSVLIALRKEHLHPEANSKQRFAFRCFSDHCIVQSRKMQCARSIRKSTNSRENKFFRVCDDTPVIRYYGVLSDETERGRKGEKIAHAVIDDRNLDLSDPWQVPPATFWQLL